MFLDRIAKRYNTLPSTIIENGLENLCFDMLVAEVGITEDNKEIKKHNEEMKKMRRRRG